MLQKKTKKKKTKTKNRKLNNRKKKRKKGKTKKHVEKSEKRTGKRAVGRSLQSWIRNFFRGQKGFLIPVDSRIRAGEIFRGRSRVYFSCSKQIFPRKFIFFF